MDYNKLQDRNVELHFCTTPPEDCPLWGDGDTCWSKCGTAGLRSAEWNTQAWQENVDTCGNWRACMLDNNYFDFSEMFDGNIKCFYSFKDCSSLHMDTGVEEMTKWQNSFEGFGGNPERRNLRKWFFPEKKLIFESQN